MQGDRMEINVEKLIEQKVEELEFEIIANEIMETQINNFIRKNLEPLLKSKIDNIISKEIVSIMSERPITTDDGWGIQESLKTLKRCSNVSLLKK